MAAKKEAPTTLAPDAPMLALIEVPGVPVPTIEDQVKLILLDKPSYSQFYERMKATTDAHVPDTTTAAGRDEITALAFKVTKSKTAIERVSKDLTEDWRAKTNAVNTARNLIVGELEALAASVKKPVTEWKKAEDDRKAANADVLAKIRADAAVQFDDTAESVATRGRAVWAMTFDPPQWTPEEAEQAETAKHATVNALVAVRDRLEKEKAERAELAALRAEKEARDLREAEEAAAQAERDRIEQERLAAEEEAERERQRIADAAQAEKDRIAAAELAAADKAREDAERAAQEAREAIQRAHDEALAAEREKSAKMERGRQMLAYIREVVGGRIGPDVQPFGILLRELEIKIDVNEADYGDMCAEIEQARIDGLANLKEQMERQAKRRQEEEDRKAEYERQEEERKRQENRAHRSKIMGEVKADLMTFGVDEETAKKIVTGIVAKVVRHTGIAF